MSRPNVLMRNTSILLLVILLSAFAVGLPGSVSISSSAQSVAVNVGTPIAFNINWAGGEQLKATFCRGSNCASCNNMSSDYLASVQFGDSPLSSSAYIADDADNTTNAFCVLYENATYSTGTASGGIFLVNHAPTVTRVDLFPATNTTMDDWLFCSYNYTDPEGDNGTGSIRWYVNGSLSPSGINQRNVTSATLGYSIGSTVYCNITNITDQRGATRAQPFVSNAVTILKGKPIATGAVINSDIFNYFNYTDSANLICNFNISNAGNFTGKNYTVLWELNTSYSQSFYLAPNDKVLTHGNTLPGDMWRCNVTPWDGERYGNSIVSPWITIGTDHGLGQNRSPYIVNFSDNSDDILSPGDDLQITIYYMNPDYNLPLNIYVCNSSSINRTGCNHFPYIEARSYNDSDPLTTNPITVNYTIQGNDPTNMLYWIELCDQNGGTGGEWRCSNFETENPPYRYAPGEPMGNFTINHRPIIGNVTLRNATGGTTFGDASNLYCNASGITDADPGDAANITRYYKWFRKGQYDADYNDTGLPSSAFMSNGQTYLFDSWICQVTPWDGKAFGTPVNSSPAFISIPAANGTPELISLTSDAPMPVYIGSTITFNLTWYDYDNPEVYGYVCSSPFINETGCGDRTLAMTGFQYPWNPIELSYLVENDTGTVTYYAIVCDQSNSTGQSLCSNQKTGNFTVGHLPTIGNVSLLNASNGTVFDDTSNVYCNVTNVTDVDGNTVTLTYKWFLWRSGTSGYVDALLPSSSMLSNGQTQIDDRWICQATPYDGFAYGHAMNSSPALIRLPATSSIPVLLALSSNAANPTFNGTTVTFNLTWADQDSTQVNGYVCSTPFINQTGCVGRTLSMTSGLTPSNPIQLSYLINNDIDLMPYYAWVCDLDSNTSQSLCSNMLSGNLSVNYAPRIDSANILAWRNNTYVQNFTSDVNLNCNVSFSDPNALNGLRNVSLKVEWFVKRYGDTAFSNYFTYYQPWQIANGTFTNWMTHGNLRVNDTWYCSVTPYDGYLYGSAYNSTQVYLGPGIPGTDIPEILNITVNSNSTNPINVGSPVTFTVNWRLNVSRNVRLFICDDPLVLPNATVVGCAGNEFVVAPPIDGGMTADNPIVVQYFVEDKDKTNQSYYAWICDDTNYTNHCSNIYASQEHGVNFFVNHKPLPRFVNVTATSFMVDGNLSCQYTYDRSEFYSTPDRNDSQIAPLDDQRNTSGATFAWYRNNVQLPYATQNLTALKSLGINKGDNISCRVVTVTDKLLLSSNYSHSANITLVNSAPVLNPYIIPAYPNSSNSLKCYANATDADLDSLNLTFQWFENSTFLVGQTNETIYSSWIHNSSTFTCMVSAADGNATVWANASVIIGAIPPNITQPINLSSTPNITVFNAAGNRYGSNITLTLNWTDRENSTQLYHAYLCNGSSITQYGCVDSTMLCSFINTSYGQKTCSINTTALVPANLTNASYAFYTKVCDNSSLCSQTATANVTVYYDKDGDGSYTDLDCDDTNSSLLAPYDDLVVNRSLTLCSRTYTLNDTGSSGVIILNTSNVILDCNGAVMNGYGNGFGLFAYANPGPTEVRNCVFSNYQFAGYYLYVNNSRIADSSFNGTSYGLYTQRNRNLTMASVSAYVNGTAGLWVYESLQVIATNVYAQAALGYPLRINSVNDSVFRGLRIDHAGTQYALVEGQNTNITLSNLQTVLPNGSLHLSNAGGTAFADSFLSSVGNVTQVIADGPQQSVTQFVNVTLETRTIAYNASLNITLNTSNVTQGAAINLTWYVDVTGSRYVSPYSNLSAVGNISNMTLQIRDRFGTLVYNRNFTNISTNLSANQLTVPTFTLSEYLKNATNTTYYSNYTFNLSSPGYYDAVQSVNISGNTRVSLILNSTYDSDSDGDPDVSDCSPNDPYTLRPRDGLVFNRSATLCPGTYNVADAGTAGVIFLNGSNITLQCNNASLIGNGSGTGIAVHGNYTLTTATLVAGTNTTLMLDGVSTSVKVLSINSFLLTATLQVGNTVQLVLPTFTYTLDGHYIAVGSITNSSGNWTVQLTYFGMPPTVSIQNCQLSNYSTALFVDPSQVYISKGSVGTNQTLLINDSSVHFSQTSFGSNIRALLEDSMLTLEDMALNATSVNASNNLTIFNATRSSINLLNVTGNWTEQLDNSSSLYRLWKVRISTTSPTSGATVAVTNSLGNTIVSSSVPSSGLNLNLTEYSRNAHETYVTQTRVSPQRVVAGQYFTCAINASDNMTYCWGDNTYGQLGDNTTISHYAPARISGSFAFTKLAAGADHVCGLLSNGSIVCWGRNDEGRLGTSSLSNSSVPRLVLSNWTFSNIHLGFAFSCGLLTNGSVACWGNNDKGQLGTGGHANSSVPILINDSRNFTDISLGGWHACGIVADGTAVCWGNNEYGELGDGTTVDASVPVDVNITTKISAFALGMYHSCAIQRNGTVACWGDDSYGQLGDNYSVAYAQNPIQVMLAGSVQSIFSGGQHSCAIHSNGTIICWGNNINGQLGDGTLISAAIPKTVPPLNSYADLTLGFRHSCGIAANGSITCWGDNQYGQAGRFQVLYDPNPKAISSITPAMQIETGYFTTCLQQPDGKHVCAGYGDINNSRWDTADLRPIPGPWNFAQLSVGYYHACGVLGDQRIACWGRNTYGQLGIGNTTNIYTPSIVNATWNFTAVVVGESHTCGLLSNGSVACWGRNADGQLGIGNTTTMRSPALVNSSYLFTSLSVHAYHSCGLLTNGSVACWGYNDFGQLGIGNTTTQISPILVRSSWNFSSIAVGESHTCGLLTNGSVACWGYNYVGQLGIGNTTTSLLPLFINATWNFTQIAVSANSCGLLANGSIACWGYNDFGQLGTGDTITRTSPALINYSGSFVEVSVGLEHACGRMSNGSVACWGSNENGQLANGAVLYDPHPGVVGVNANNQTTIRYSTTQLTADFSYNPYTLLFAASGFSNRTLQRNITDNAQISVQLFSRAPVDPPVTPPSSGGGGGGGGYVPPVKNATATGGCLDGIMNGNELGVDCGGRCAACSPSPPVRPPVIPPAQPPAIVDGPYPPVTDTPSTDQPPVEQPQSSDLWLWLMLIIGTIVLASAIGYYFLVMRKPEQVINPSPMPQNPVMAPQPVPAIAPEEPVEPEYTDPLKRYVKKQLDKGKPLIEIKEALLLKGWDEDAVDQALKEVALRR